MTRCLKIAGVALCVVAASAVLYGCKPTISWSPDHIDETLQPGQTATVPIKVSVDKIDQDVSVVVSPEIAPYVTVQPATIGKIQKSKTLSIVVNFSIPVTALQQKISGSISLVQGKGNSTILGKSLSVRMQIIWPHTGNSSGSVSFAYPAFGSTGEVSVEPITYSSSISGTVYTVSFASESDPNKRSQYLITVINNPIHYRTISEWVINNVDSGEQLLASGTFSAHQLSNGIAALVLDGPIPDGYDGGPLSTIYAMSSSSESIITITRAFDSTFSKNLHLSRADIGKLYLGILESMALP